MNDTELTDDEREKFEQQWQQLDEKVILAQILSELQQIRLLLSNAETGASDDSDTDTQYRCTKCFTVVPEDERERHASEKHKALPDMVESMFEEVDG